MLFEFPHHLPKLHSVRVHLEECISFLKDTGHYGAVQLLWEDPASKQFIGLKLSRKLVPQQSEYYRLPPTVTPTVRFCFVTPQISTAPFVEIVLNEKEQVDLHTVLLKELTYQQRG